MKFYEFIDFPYYALIGAENEDKAKEFYSEVVCDLEGDEGELTEVTREKARVELLCICKNKEQRKEAITEFDMNTEGKEPYLILIDGSLL